MVLQTAFGVAETRLNVVKTMGQRDGVGLASPDHKLNSDDVSEVCQQFKLF